VSLLQLAKACDHGNVTQVGMHGVSRTFKRGAVAIGHGDKSPCPPAYKVASMMQATSRELEKFGVKQYPANSQHHGYHVSSSKPTLRLAALENALKSTCFSKADLMLVAKLFDGADMAGARNRVMAFLNMACHNKLLEGRSAHGEMSEDKQYMLACAELRAETYANIRSMVDDWLTPEVNAFEEGLKTLKPVVDNIKVLRKAIVELLELLHRRISQLPSPSSPTPSADSADSAEGADAAAIAAAALAASAVTAAAHAVCTSDAAAVPQVRTCTCTCSCATQDHACAERPWLHAPPMLVIVADCCPRALTNMYILCAERPRGNSAAQPGGYSQADNQPARLPGPQRRYQHCTTFTGTDCALSDRCQATSEPTKCYIMQAETAAAESAVASLRSALQHIDAAILCKYQEGVLRGWVLEVRVGCQFTTCSNGKLM
jgi:hypothetical protein